MSLNVTNWFSTAFSAIEAFFKVATSAPQVVAQSATAIVQEAAPVIDSIGGTGTADKITHEVASTTQTAIDFVTPHLQQAEMAETVVKGLATIFTAGAAKATQATTPVDQAPAPAVNSTPAPAQNDTTQAQTPAT